jgi:sporulation integral membrane protein YtvI
MLEFYRRYWKTAFDIGLIILTVLLIMWIFSYLYSIAAPIFLSFLVFIMIEPLAKFLHKRGMKKAIATAISVLLFVLVLLGLLVGAGLVFVRQIENLIALLNRINSESLMLEMQTQFEIWTERFAELNLPVELLDKVQELAAVAAEWGADLAVSLLRAIYTGLSSVSTFVVNFLIGIILAYFLSVEISDWQRIAREKTPRTFKLAFVFLRDNVLKGIAGYVKAQLKLISITFIIIYIALLLLGVGNAFSISVLAAIFDILPLLGVSTLFVPWIIYLFIAGNMSLAIWLTVLWAVVVTARQILEPKITGNSLGVSAFTMLSFMIVSLSLFGIAGLVLSPVLIVLIKALIDQGYLQQWIRKPDDY